MLLLTCQNRCVDLLYKLIEWFLCDGNIGLEWVKWTLYKKSRLASFDKKQLH